MLPDRGLTAFIPCSSDPLAPHLEGLLRSFGLFLDTHFLEDGKGNEVTEDDLAQSGTKLRTNLPWRLRKRGSLPRIASPLSLLTSLDLPRRKFTIQFEDGSRKVVRLSPTLKLADLIERAALERALPHPVQLNHVALLPDKTILSTWEVRLDQLPLGADHIYLFRRNSDPH